MLLIIDNASDFIRKFETRLKESRIKYKIINHKARIDLMKIKNVKGVILSGGSTGLYNKSVINNYVVLHNFDVPIMSFCMGYELIAVAFGGAIEKLPKPQNKMQEVIIDKKDAIFKGLSNKIMLREKHVNHVSRMPKGYEILAHSTVCPVEVFKHKTKPIYGFQSHPEVSGKDGDIIMNNYLDMCGIKKLFD